MKNIHILKFDASNQKEMYNIFPLEIGEDSGIEPDEVKIEAKTENLWCSWFNLPGSGNTGETSLVLILLFFVS